MNIAVKQMPKHWSIMHTGNELVQAKMGSQSVRVVTHAGEQCSLVNPEYCDQYLMLHNVTVNIVQYQSVMCMHIIYYCTAVIASKSF